MTNIERATEHLDSLDSLFDRADGTEPNNAQRAQALADAGYLAPNLPEPRTLADELRDEARELPEYSQSMYRLAAFADRVETLEQERDEGNRAVNEVRDWSHEVGMENKRLSEELAEARVSVEEQAAEIVRLRAREIPDGWRIAEHQDYGTVLVPRLPGNPVQHSFAWIKGSGVAAAYLRCLPEALSFRDEAPAPQPEMDAR